MGYQLFVGDSCHDCQKVQKTIVELGVELDIRNLDNGDKAPMELFILPALLNENGELLAYGVDIIEFLKEKENKKSASWPKALFKRFLNFD